ncbi:hypothetical protein M2132_000395 [Dysgonomonas sp. PH5-45]|uniref:DUF4595 domain-containing protein n=1 Tax=unclassified Dysgonomonas TaxID=2630389 RepID=UPI002476BBD4|nr:MULTISPECIES: DUF4595 domain-containing protein [unclassified Dysgonomonas]MDH6354073.1 hypothetical protein [Dysgonomonas sp. PH5-45]MDH6387076.1 hypothetical protein [Dysgonomonas sp. PH5-37]
MKKYFVLLLLVFLFFSCNKKADKVFQDRWIEHVVEKYPDMKTVESFIQYDNQDRLSCYVDVTVHNGITSYFAIDSVKYEEDEVIMFDRFDKRIFRYKMEEGYATECYVTSLSGRYIVRFFYEKSYLVRIVEERPISFAKGPEVFCDIKYNADHQAIGFKNKYYDYKFLPSLSIENKNSLLLPPIYLGDYKPAFYAGILGKTTQMMIYQCIDNKTGAKTDYEYVDYKNGMTLALINEKGEGTSFNYVFRDKEEKPAQR